MTIAHLSGKLQYCVAILYQLPLSERDMFSRVLSNAQYIIVSRDFVQ
jgi:hypothetical protein